MTDGKCRDASPEQDRLSDSWAATGEDGHKDAGAAAEEEGPKDVIGAAAAGKDVTGEHGAAGGQWSLKRNSLEGSEARMSTKLNQQL